MSFYDLDNNNSDYWITPLKESGGLSVETIIRRLVMENNVYAFGYKAHGRKSLKVGDWICFYAAKKGVIGHARVVSPPKELFHNWLPRPERFPWVFSLEQVRIYIDNPLKLNRSIREQLEAFTGREDEINFGWFVRSTHRISKHDFDILTKP